MKQTIICVALFIAALFCTFMLGRTTAKPDKTQYLNLNAVTSTSLHNGELHIISDGEEYILYIKED